MKTGAALGASWDEGHPQPFRLRMVDEEGNKTELRFGRHAALGLLKALAELVAQENTTVVSQVSTPQRVNDNREVALKRFTEMLMAWSKRTGNPIPLFGMRRRLVDGILDALSGEEEK